MIQPHQVGKMTFAEILLLGGSSEEKLSCITEVEEIVKYYICAGSKKERRRAVKTLQEILNLPDIDIGIAEKGNITYGYVGFPRGEYVLVAMYQENPKIDYTKHPLKIVR